MENGKFTIDRKIFGSDIWYASPWKLKIWIYLIGHANYKDTEVLGIQLKRGELIRGLRTIREDCAYKVGYRIKKPSLDTVRRCCEELTKELRIQRRTVHGLTVITVLNYNELQPFKNNEPYAEPNAESYNGRTVVVQDNKRIRKKKKEKKEIYIPYNNIIDLYNSTCNTMPKVKLLTDGRKNTIRLRWLRFGTKHGVEIFKELFEIAHDSDFLSGRNGKWTACNFDWLLNEKNMVKVLEGTYGDTE